VSPHVKRLPPEQREIKARQVPGRGSALLRHGQAAQAIPLLERPHSLLPEDVPTTVNLGGVPAMRCFHQAVQANPLDLHARCAWERPR
jgi:hypothetical protein